MGGRAWVWAGLSLLAAACGENAATSPDTGAPADTGTDAGAAADGGPLDVGAESDLGTAPDAGLPEDAGDPDWQTAHCADRDCYFVMQAQPGADDLTCNGRSPIALGTTDPQGLGDCPFASLQSRVRAILSPETGPARRRTVFVGAGSYPVWPGLSVHGDGAGPEESVIFTTYRGQAVTLDGTCPASCTVETSSGTITRTPCCGRRCPTCDASPLCVPAVGGESTCAVPLERSEQLLTLYGQWVRVEGFEIRGCWEDGVRVAWTDRGNPPEIVPNGPLFIVNNSIEGCDVNENIKGLRNGPGPLQGGPEWGPVQVIGNELFAMASQAVDATGVHNWLVEDNHLHDAKRGGNQFITFDGGGLGFKNGGSHVALRNNWSQAGGGFGLGGGSGSCAEDTTAPADWGCFQHYEMIDMLVENNVAIDPGGAFPVGSSSSRGLGLYHCDDCRFLGNVLSGDIGVAGVLINDECPGPRCPAYNPSLEPTRNFVFERNRIQAGVRLPSGAPVMFMYQRDSAPIGPAGNGMRSADNTFCAASGFPVVADPESQAEQFGHRDPGMAYALADYRAQIGDQGSAVFNSAGAALAPCPAAPEACTITPQDGTMDWAGPLACANCACALVYDDGAERPVACSGSSALPPAALVPGRHYVSLRVARDGGGTSCGASYNIGAPMIGTACRIGADQTLAEWSARGVSCRLFADGGIDLGSVPCSGMRALMDVLLVPGRHHLRLKVEDAADGQTTCGLMFNR